MSMELREGGKSEGRMRNDKFSVMYLYDCPDLFNVRWGGSGEKTTDVIFGHNGRGLAKGTKYAEKLWSMVHNDI